MLMARLATRTAKPDGQCYIPPERVCFGKFFMFISLCVCLNVIIFKCLKPGILAALNFLLLIKKQPYHFVGFHTFLCFPFFFCGIISCCHESCRLSYIWQPFKFNWTILIVCLRTTSNINSVVKLLGILDSCFHFIQHKKAMPSLYFLTVCLVEASMSRAYSCIYF